MSENELARLLREAREQIHLPEANRPLDAALALVENAIEADHVHYWLAGAEPGTHEPCYWTNKKHFLVIPLTRPVEVEERHREWADQICGAYNDCDGDGISAAARRLAELERGRGDG